MCKLLSKTVFGFCHRLIKKKTQKNLGNTYYIFKLKMCWKEIKYLEENRNFQEYVIRNDNFKNSDSLLKSILFEITSYNV